MVSNRPESLNSTEYPFDLVKRKTVVILMRYIPLESVQMTEGWGENMDKNYGHQGLKVKSFRK